MGVSTRKIIVRLSMRELTVQGGLETSTAEHPRARTDNRLHGQELHLRK